MFSTDKADTDKGAGHRESDSHGLRGDVPPPESSVLMQLNPQRFLHVDPLGKFRKRKDIAKSLVQARRLQGEREAKMNGGKPLAHKPCVYVSVGAKSGEC